MRHREEHFRERAQLVGAGEGIGERRATEHALVLVDVSENVVGDLGRLDGRSDVAVTGGRLAAPRAAEDETEAWE